MLDSMVFKTLVLVVYNCPVSELIDFSGMKVREARGIQARR